MPYAGHVIKSRFGNIAVLNGQAGFGIIGSSVVVSDDQICVFHCCLLLVIWDEGLIIVPNLRQQINKQGVSILRKYSYQR